MASRARSLLFAGLTLSLACERGPSTTPPPDEVASEVADENAELIAEAIAGVDDPELAALLQDHWLSVHETSAYFVEEGWGEFGAEGRAAAEGRRLRWRAQARAVAGRADGLSERDRVSLEMFVTGLDAGAAGEVCEFWSWTINTRDNPLEQVNDAIERAYLPDRTHGERELRRLRAFGPVVESRIADLRHGLAAGRVADRQTLVRTIEMLDGQLATPASEWGLAIKAREKVESTAPDEDADGGPSGWEAGEREAFVDELEAVIDDQLRPDLERFTAVLRDELLPAARGPEQVGVSALPDGQACYAAMILTHTSEARDAQALHELGLAEIARIDAEFERLGEQVFGPEGGELAALLERLRTDPNLYFDSSEAVEAFAAESLAAAVAAIPEWFGRLPQAPCEVRPIPAYQAPFTYVGYYNPPTPAQNIGYYSVNTHAPETRPRFQARALAAHESIPGHHLQIALARELDETPAFRRHAGTTVFVEGWALYSERLADEMGLYRDDLDRLGALSYDAWRASRLVVDTGIHHLGWTREQARAFMRAHTALAEGNIVNEVDRYVSWPGQALGYKYGQLEILRLRAEAEAELGERFSIADFHDVVLGAGAVTLPILRRRVREWIERTAA